MRRIVAGRPFDFTQVEIEARMSSEQPGPIRIHGVWVGGRRFPPNQVIETVTGWPRKSFRTQDSLRLLEHLGFTADRRDDPPAERMRVAFVKELLADRELDDRNAKASVGSDAPLLDRELWERTNALAEANHQAVIALSRRLAQVEQQLRAIGRDSC
ncbi:hypothetical protein [Jatrophihabitans fulvus]